MLKKGLLVGGALLIGLFLLFLFYPFPDESSSVQKDADNSGQEGELSELKEAQSTVLRQISRDSSAVKPDVQFESEPKIATKLPPLRESDEFIRDKVSDWGLPKLWVDNESLIARYAALIASISRGELPRRQLAFLVPKGNFKVLRDGEKIFASPENYRRFDNFVDLVEQVPVGRLAQLLREIDPLVRISLRQLGLSGLLNRFSLARLTEYCRCPDYLLESSWCNRRSFLNLLTRVLSRCRSSKNNSSGWDLEI